MVGQWPTRCLQARTGRTERRNHMLRKSLHALVPQLGVRAEGLDVRKKSPLSKEEKCFFLTSPFIEPRIFVAFALLETLIALTKFLSELVRRLPVSRRLAQVLRIRTGATRDH